VATTRVNLGLLRFAIPAVVIAVVAFALAMCSPSHDASDGPGKPTVSAVPPLPAPSGAAPAPTPLPLPVGKDYVEGMVESVSGDRIALRTRTGSATVAFAPSTPVFRATPAQLTDVTPGSCVNVRATRQSAPSASDITAQAVTITSAVDGKCPPPAGFYGTVASVSGNTIVVSGWDSGGGHATPTTVTVAGTTSYTKQTLTSTQAITNGTCMGAQGTNEGDALQAATISLRTCPPTGGPRHHFHLPHLPHPHI